MMGKITFWKVGVKPSYFVISEWTKLSLVSMLFEMALVRELQLFDILFSIG